jgi:hypothetical protein
MGIHKKWNAEKEKVLVTHSKSELGKYGAPKYNRSIWSIITENVTYVQ